MKHDRLLEAAHADIAILRELRGNPDVRIVLETHNPQGWVEIHTLEQCVVILANAYMEKARQRRR